MALADGEAREERLKAALRALARKMDR